MRSNGTAVFVETPRTDPAAAVPAAVAASPSGWTSTCWAIGATSTGVVTGVPSTVVAVDDLSFTVEPGRVTGFLGPNGSGKTTTLRVLLGLVHATAGTATIGDRNYGEFERPSKIVGASLSRVATW